MRAEVEIEVRKISNKEVKQLKQKFNDYLSQLNAKEIKMNKQIYDMKQKEKERDVRKSPIIKIKKSRTIKFSSIKVVHGNLTPV